MDVPPSTLCHLQFSDRHMNDPLRLFLGVSQLFHFLDYLRLEVLLPANLADPDRDIGDYR